MEVTRYKGHVYGKLESHFFVWDDEWDSFRPIERIGWNGSEVVVVDQKYKDDIFSPVYGYGSPEMKQLCRRLSDTTELGIPESDSISWFQGEWWRDRMCVFAFDCSSRSPQSWKKYIAYTKSRAKTLRAYKTGRATRRLLLK